jgi:hypothetical protein
LPLTLSPALSLGERGQSPLSLRERAREREAIKMNSKYRVIRNYCSRFGLGLWHTLLFITMKRSIIKR